MPSICLLVALSLTSQKPEAAAAHADNPIYKRLVKEGLTLSGVSIRLPAPSLADGQDEKAGRATLASIAGDERAARELARDSITAPLIFKSRDTKTGDAILRQADVWFVVHANLDEVDPDRALAQVRDQDVEAGNMRFVTKVLGDADLRAAGVERLPASPGRKEWFTHLDGRLLDRIKMETTERAVSTRSADSLVVASMADPAFDRDPKSPNRWATLSRQGTNEVKGLDKVYQGGCSYVKLTRIAAEPDALLVEAHLAFVEPLGWFQGNPILKSKINVVAQDQVRRLRREIEKQRRPK